MTHPSETTTYADARSGRLVRQLTSQKCHSHHLYFTNPGWFDGGRRLLFGSDRGGRTNLYSVHLESGEITQHTDADMPPPPRETSFLFASLNPTRPEAYFWRGSDLMAVDLNSNRERKLYRAADGYVVNMTNVSADGKTVCTGVFEDLSGRFKVDLLNGYVGFREYFEARPRSIILGIDTETGATRELFSERYWIGHVNTSPTQAHLVSFCHEGPWQEVDNRIWMLDMTSGVVKPLRQRKVAGEAVGHEYWHADGVHVGYHGQRRDGTKFFGRLRYDGADEYEVAFPHHTGHIHSNDFNLIVGDGSGDAHKCILLWRWNGEGFDGPRVLCVHRGSFQVQQVHVHPRFSPDGRKVVYCSDRTGYGQVYEVEVGAWDDLPPLAAR